MKYYAIDTETTLIKDRPCLLRDRGAFIAGSAFSRKGAIYTGPYAVPRLLFGSYWGPRGGSVYPAGVFITFVRALLQSTPVHFVFHNTAFDIPVLCKAAPELTELFWAAMEQGRVHDSMALDVLVRLSTGLFDSFNAPQMRSRSLEEVATEYCNITLTKDPAVRLGFEQFENRVLPQAYHDYALQDAEATYKAWQNLLARCPDDKLLSEPLQTRAAVALSSLDQHGVHIDRAEATRLRRLFEQDIPPLEKTLVAAGLGRWEPRPKSVARTKRPHTGWQPSGVWQSGTDQAGAAVISRVKVYKKHEVVEVASPVFRLNTKALRARLEALGKEEGVEIKRTPTGLLAMDAEAWAYYIPATDEGLTAWTKYEKLTKIVGTYLKLYSVTDSVFPRWHNLGARSGRMSASSPAVQQVPKRKWGIRSVFVPRPGCVFVAADYAYMELVTLAQTMCDMGIKGPLFEALQQTDPHTRTAALLTGKAEEDVTKVERQGAKALSFGAMGGLGPRKLADYARKTFGVIWTYEEARAKLRRHLEVYWDIAKYLKSFNTDFNSNLMRASGRGITYWRELLGVVSPGIRVLKLAMLAHSSEEIRRLLWAAERSLTVTLRSGRVRKGCTYTEGANTGGQGPASDVTKQAAFLAVRRGLEATLVVHDELVVTCLPNEVVTVKEVLEKAMLEAFVELCPDTGPFAKVEISGPLQRWGGAKDGGGNVV